MESQIKILIPYILSHNQAFFLQKQLEKLLETRISEHRDPYVEGQEIRVSESCDRDVGQLFRLVWQDFIHCFSS